MRARPLAPVFLGPFLGLMVVASTGCLQPDDFEVRSVAIADFRSLGEAETTVGVDIGLYNPNGYAVHIEDSQLGLWVARDSVGFLSFVPGEQIGRRTEAEVRLNAVLDSRVFGEVLSKHWFEFLIQGAPIRVEGWVRGKAWGVKRTLQIQQTQRVRVLENSKGPPR